MSCGDWVYSNVTAENALLLKSNTSSSDSVRWKQVEDVNRDCRDEPWWFVVGQARGPCALSLHMSGLGLPATSCDGTIDIEMCQSSPSFAEL